MVQCLSIKFFNFCWVFQKFPYFCVILYIACFVSLLNVIFLGRFPATVATFALTALFRRRRADRTVKQRSRLMSCFPFTSTQYVCNKAQ